MINYYNFFYFVALSYKTLEKDLLLFLLVKQYGFNPVSPLKATEPVSVLMFLQKLRVPTLCETLKCPGSVSVSN